MYVYSDISFSSWKLQFQKSEICFDSLSPIVIQGAIGMAHDAEEVNDASSQFFFLKWNQDLVTPGRNTIDGSNCCFGYIVKNQDLLEQISVGDVILNIRLVDGEQNFKGSI